jgi:hypothetical protein
MNQPLLAQTIISSMITPAFLILGAANLANIALQRLGRAVDRARKLIDLYSAEPARLAPATIDAWLERYRRRALLAETAVFSFFGGVGIFVSACLLIALDHYLGGTVTWLPVGMTILGMLVMLCGAVLLAKECRIARRQIHEKIRLRAFTG